MIPSPNLDDRTFDDIVQEAIRLIPQYCPEWTNHNPGDPGIALLELFAWMTEMTLYRLNRVPEKNYLAFLELMGVTLRPPQPARTVLQFTLHPNADRALIPAGTRVGTRPQQDGSFVTFETEHDLVATNNVLVRCLSQHHEAFADHTAVLVHRPLGGAPMPGVPVWAGARAMERYLYLGDPALEFLGESAVLTVRTTTASADAVPLGQLLEFAYFDGERWRELEPAPTPTDRDQVALLGPSVPMKPVTIGDRTGLFVRGKLVDLVAKSDDAQCSQILMRLELVGDGERPDLAYTVADHGAQFRVDLDRQMQPFGRQPVPDAMLYLLSQRVLGQVDAEVRVDVELADLAQGLAPAGSADLVLAWEYWNGKRWRQLGQSRMAPSAVTAPGATFRDETRCLTRSGAVIFQCPRDARTVEFAGVLGPWIRVRIERGDYGVPGSFELENDQFVWKDARPLRPPVVKRIGMRFTEREHPFSTVLAYNDFVVTDHTMQAQAELQGWTPFVPVADESPTLYLGFRHAFSPEPTGLWLDIVEHDGAGGGLLAAAGQTTRGLEHATPAQAIAWEYWNGEIWGDLGVRDHTMGLTESGFVSFVGPPDQVASRRYGESLHWLRARLEFGGYDQPPLLRDVVLHAVTGHNVTTFGETVLGSSTGLPNQTFRFVRGPVLPGQAIVVREGGDGGAWVAWTAVESFLDSGPTSRHYVKEAGVDEVRFGDGRHGLVPPKGDRNVVCQRYQVGGGELGNVPADALTVLLRGVPSVDRVRNVRAASGGCDAETVAEAKERGPRSLKARGRAVTAEDFEWLAREASTTVARVCVLSGAEHAGEVTVVVVPKLAETGVDRLDKPVASTELLHRVRNYLADRKLLSTIVHVQRPRYRELSVQVELIVLQSTASERVRREIEQRIRQFLHPLHGGRDGAGWPFGRSVYRVDLYHVIEDVPGVDFVDRVRLVDEVSKRELEQCKLGQGELVHCVRVDTVEKAHARVV